MVLGKWKFTKKLFNKYWGLINTSVPEPPERVEIPVVTCVSSDSPPSGLNVYVQHPLCRPQLRGAVCPQTLTFSAYSSKPSLVPGLCQPVTCAKAQRGSGKCKLLIVAGTSSYDTFPTSFYFVIWCDSIKLNSHC